MIAAPANAAGYPNPTDDLSHFCIDGKVKRFDFGVNDHHALNYLGFRSNNRMQRTQCSPSRPMRVNHA